MGKSTKNLSSVTFVGLDIAKNVFQVQCTQLSPSPALRAFRIWLSKLSALSPRLPRLGALSQNFSNGLNELHLSWLRLRLASVLILSTQDD
jgi:hypothetical protein